MQNGRKKVRPVNAIYTAQLIREYQGNPLIEALPEIIDSPKKFSEMTKNLPAIYEEDREQPATYRAHMLDNIRNFFQPLSYHVEVEQKVSKLIRQGYVNRNPFKENIDPAIIYGQKYPITQPDSSTVAELGIFGISGMGKTTLINKVLSLYPRMILHTNYKGDKTVRYQIPWIKVETPSGCRIKSLSLNIVEEIDKLFGEDTYYRKANAKREYEQISYLRDIFDIHSVGLLVIDEIQNIRGIASKESDKIMRFFVELSNVLNVPIVLVGTLKALPLFGSEMKNCRRIADSKPMYKSENGQEWRAFLKSLFKLQWTKHPVELTDELIDLFYEESQGITNIVIKLFTFAQLRAMYTGEERITTSIIKSVALDSLIPLRPLLDALKSNKEKYLLKYEDLYDANKFFKSYTEKEKHNFREYEKSLGIKEELDELSDEEHHLVTSIATFLSHAGFETYRSRVTALAVVREYGVDEDIKLLRRKAYELMALDDQGAEVAVAFSGKKASKPKAKKEKEASIRMLKVHEEAGDKNLTGYEALKEAGYIGGDDDL